MSVQAMPNEFWEVFNQARDRVKQRPAWKLCQIESQFALEQAWVPDAVANKIKSTNFHETILLVQEIYRIMAGEKPNS